ncbi:unnamed protein product [Rodentolepis nana]|uniref:Importin-9 n=1 Tax=Rodentolepis nana TaxID=102285 RepID=A0A0R3T9F5_RODNA|nr:unnamed protein product [Rodentolepis nana]
MRKKTSHKKSKKSDRKRKEFTNRKPQRYLDYIKSIEMRQYEDQIFGNSVDLNSWNSGEFGDGMEGSEEDMRQCLLLFTQILFPQFTDYHQFFIQDNTKGVGLDDTQEDDDTNSDNLASIISTDFMDDNYGSEGDMKQCLLLLAQVLFPQFQHRLQQFFTEEGSFSEQAHRGEAPLNGQLETDDFLGSEEDMKQCLLLLAQVLYPQFAQRIQMCCDDETSTYNEVTMTSSVGRITEETDPLSSIDDEMYGNEEDMKECLLHFAQILYPQFATYLEECLCDEDTLNSEEFPSSYSHNTTYKDESSWGVRLAVT